MKKLLVIGIATVALTACCCSYDYYESGTRYTQDGADCIYRNAEEGRRFDNEVRSLDTDKRVVYRDTICRDLYKKNNSQTTPVASVKSEPTVVVVKSAPQKIVKRRYVIVAQ